MRNFPIVDAAALKAALAGVAQTDAAAERELALLDVSEEGEFGFGHLLRAVNVPYSRLELLIEPLVPRKSCRLVLMDQGNGIAARAANRLSVLGYRDISIFPGGVAAWAAAGGEVFAGVYVPSKAFGEWIEQVFGTPHIDADELASLIQTRADVIVLDPRTEAEHIAGHVPAAINCPGGELVYRFDDLVASPETLVVVACGGRTRGIVGAQTLINAGVPNRVVHLADGNHGWRLSGRDLERGLARSARVSRAGADAARIRARALGERTGVPVVDTVQLRQWCDDPHRTTFVFDVRTPGEFARGHHPLARSAPGGQLVQATDQWLGTLGSRVVLVDSDGVRAIATAQWLLQMGWDVHVLDNESAFIDDAADSVESGADFISPDEAARVARELRGPAVNVVPEITADAAQELLRVGALAVSLERSVDYLAAHPPGAVWVNRARIEELDEAVAQGRELVLFSEDGRVAQLAAIDLLERHPAAASRVKAVRGGKKAWLEAGLPLVCATEDALSPERRIDFLQWAPGRRQGNKEAMQAYLNWEKNLLQQVANEGFRYGAPGRND